MTPDQITYLVFGIVLVLAVIFDLGLLSKRSSTVTIKRALLQTFFWVALALIFMLFIWLEQNEIKAFEYLSAYLMEWSLSIDNIFVFILIFTFFKIKSENHARALLIGILLAVVLRIIFITVGVALVQRFEWLLYVFGGILLITGIRIFAVRQESDFDPAKNIIYRWMKKILPLIPEDINGKFRVKRNGKIFYTNLFMVIVLLATTDIVFALDSIPAVFAITQDKLLIYTSNIFAVLGLRSLFFLLKGAVSRFEYLQQGIAIVLIFVGLKMLAEIFYFTVPSYISLIVIIICLGGSIFYSIQASAKKIKEE